MIAILKIEGRKEKKNCKKKGNKVMRRIRKIILVNICLHSRVLCKPYMPFAYLHFMAFYQE